MLFGLDEFFRLLQDPSLSNTNGHPVYIFFAEANLIDKVKNVRMAHCKVRVDEAGTRCVNSAFALL